jgi:hypothetical protein
MVMITGSPTWKLVALLNTSEYSTDPNVAMIVKIPSRKPRSPTRFIMNALRAALL